MMSRTLIITVVVAVCLASAFVLARSSAKNRQKSANTAVKQATTNAKANFRKLPANVARIVEGCGTEPAFSGKFLKHKAKGTYTCTRCNAPLFNSKTKFSSGSGWPSFDDAIPGAVEEIRDADGSRTEIRCARCGGHLGHVFRGERMTTKNTRHCVNSLSMGFSAAPLAEAFYAGGCFWGVEHLLESVKGVVSAESGYMGGKVQAPTYKQICTTDTGHAEAVRVLFNPTVISYEQLTKRFFEIHDPTHVNRQGPDRGKQYRSAVFVTDDAQSKTVRKLIGILVKKGLKVATKVEKAGRFWPAESYHQDYYKKSKKTPYCHARTKRF
jgi:peptide methionine sulfoxide reductase msrA/msrB